MNMNKILLIVIAIVFLILPNISVNADNTKKTVYCQLEYEDNTFSSDTCSQDKLNDMLKDECGDDEASNITYTCGGIFSKTYKGSSIQDACQKVSNEVLLKLGASGNCTAADKIIGESFCEEGDVLKALSFIGFIIFFLKMLIPLIIIIMATFDYYKAIIDDKDDALVKQTKVLLKRILIGIIIFFIPTFINLSLMLVSGWSDIENDYKKCAKCLLDPISSCEQ